MARQQEKAGKYLVEVLKIHTNEAFEKAKMIRYNVFVIGQNVPLNEEIDEFENESFHFLASANDIPCGVARWRFTEKGIKLERFAVLEKYRGLGVGSALVEAVLMDIHDNPKSVGKSIYLHSQLSALKLYQKFGFKKEGELFQECDIDHFKMVR